MQLKSFRVTNFRSVSDSGWIEVARIGAFIGVNESGKTNLLTPLWKLHPVREGEIQPTSDYPKKMFGEIREAPANYCFISAVFTVPALLAREIGDLVDEEVATLGHVIVSRFFDGNWRVAFPDCPPPQPLAHVDLFAVLNGALTDIQAATVSGKEESVRGKMTACLTSTISRLTKDGYGVTDLDTILAELVPVVPAEVSRTSVISPRYSQTIEMIEGYKRRLSKPNPGLVAGVPERVLAALPHFVFYSNYGNLDSEIYLPHVVQNLARADLGSKDAAKARTLRVLFKFVRLSPEEILELGQDFKDPANPAREPTVAEAAAIGEKKRERSILLQSAGALLTRRFREWWKQGDYRFRFEADGNHFRIWVADDRRPEEIELESRSTGLQWFLSFYLVFLVESEGAHRNSILLLDEPGLSLHPLAQRDLSDFFEGLAVTNQIMYTTHSPFLVDADHLDRARKVYVALDGTTKATDNLREGAEGPGQAGAAYAVHSALNLTVAESLLLGCQPVIVEGSSDQHYLTAIKTILIRSGKAKPKRELVFPPSGGTKTARMVASILTGRDDALPLVFLDGDVMARKMASELKASLYSGSEDRVMSVGDFIRLENAEVEDLVPPKFLANVVDRWLRVQEPDDELSATIEVEKPIVPQIENWAAKHDLPLEKGWKVILAKRVKQQLLIRGIESVDAATQATWIGLFEKLDA